MTLHLHLQIAGFLLLALGLAHVFFNGYFGWDRELEPLSLLTRRVFQVHCFFIALVLVLMGQDRCSMPTLCWNPRRLRVLCSPESWCFGFAGYWPSSSPTTRQSGKATASALGCTWLSQPYGFTS